MATLINNKSNTPNCLQLFRNDVVKNKNLYDAVQREGYMRRVTYTLLFFHSQSEYKFLHNLKTTPDEMKSFFFINDRMEDGSHAVIRDIDPWICFSENGMICLYFGEDKPIRKTKTVKTNTKHKRTWAINQCFIKPDDRTNENTYNYWYVKDKTKLILCEHSIDKTMNLFPKLEYKYKSFVTDDISILYKNEPFKCSDEYDYTEEEKQEIIRKEKEAEEERQRRLAELERRKETPGFCSCCGSEHASYVLDPFQLEINGIHEMRWLCDFCYESIAGDI